MYIGIHNKIIHCKNQYTHRSVQNLINVTVLCCYSKKLEFIVIMHSTTVIVINRETVFGVTQPSRVCVDITYIFIRAPVAPVNLRTHTGGTR